MKTRRVVDLFAACRLPRRRHPGVPAAGRAYVGKVLASAVANARTTTRSTRARLVVSEAFVDEGPDHEAFRPRAQGRA